MRCYVCSGVGSVLTIVGESAICPQCQGAGTIADPLEVKALHAERDDLRAQLRELTGRCTCVWCGQMYQLGPTLEECRTGMLRHMESCTKHPIHSLHATNVKQANIILELVLAVEGLLKEVSEPAGLNMEIAKDRQKFSQFLRGCEERMSKAVCAAEAALARVEAGGQ